MSRYRPRRRRKNSLVGLWIGLGVGGGLLLIIAIVLLVTLTTDKDASPGNGAGSINEMFGGGGIDDGSPVRIFNPRFYKDQRGLVLLRVNYELKRPEEIPENQSLTMFLICGKPGGFEAHLQVPRSFEKSDLKEQGTFDLQLFNFLDMPKGARLPAGRVYWELGDRRISNVLTVDPPSSANNLPIVPEMSSG